jgi:hypothetical protein
MGSHARNPIADMLFISRHFCMRSPYWPSVADGDRIIADLVGELRFVRNQAESCCATESLHPVSYMQFIIDVCQMKVHRALADEQFVSNFFARFTLNDEGQNFDFPLSQFDCLVLDMRWPNPVARRSARNCGRCLGSDSTKNCHRLFAPFALPPPALIMASKIQVFTWYSQQQFEILTGNRDYAGISSIFA